MNQNATIKRQGSLTRLSDSFNSKTQSRSSIKKARGSVLPSDILTVLNQIQHKRIEDNEIVDQVKYYKNLQKQQNLEDKEDQKVNIEEFKNLLVNLENDKKNKESYLNRLNQMFRSEINDNDEQLAEQKQIILEQLDKIELRLDEEEDKSNYAKQKIFNMNFEIQNIRADTVNIKQQIEIVCTTYEELKTNQWNHVLAVKQLKHQKQQISDFLKEQQEFGVATREKLKEIKEEEKQKIYQNIQKNENMNKEIENKQKQLKQTQNQILEIQDQIELKWELIQRCADFLDELDDFDKLALIFIYDKPESFNLQEIYKVLQQQIKQPKDHHYFSKLYIINRLIDQPIEDFVERLRFNQVSIRMSLFIKFHNNNLENVVVRLVNVFKQLQIYYSTYQSQHDQLNMSLMSLTKEYKQLTEQLNKLQSHYVYDDSDHFQDSITDENKLTKNQMDLEFLYSKIHSQENLFLILFQYLTQALCREVNTINNIKEILKSCDPSDFDEEFYTKWTYTSIFQKLKQCEKLLEEQFYVNILAANQKARHSNAFLNQIYDQLENKQPKSPKKQKNKYLTNKQLVIQNQLEKYFGNLKPNNISQIFYTIFTNNFLSVFINQANIQMINEKCKNFEEIIDFLHQDCKHLCYQQYRTQIVQLFEFLKDIILFPDTVQSLKTNKSQKKKINIKQLIQKHSTKHKYDSQEWRKNLVKDRLQYFQTVKTDASFDCDLSIELNPQDKQQSMDQTNEKKFMQLVCKNDELQKLKKQMYQLKNDCKRAKTNRIQKVNEIDIFNYMNTQHHSHKIKKSESNKYQKMIKNIKIDERLSSSDSSSSISHTQKKMNTDQTTENSCGNKKIKTFHTNKDSQYLASYHSQKLKKLTQIKKLSEIFHTPQLPSAKTYETRLQTESSNRDSIREAYGQKHGSLSQNFLQQGKKGHKKGFQSTRLHRHDDQKLEFRIVNKRQ